LEEYLLKKNGKNSKKKTVVFYVVIAALTVLIAVGASMPYILSRMDGDGLLTHREYPKNGDGIDLYGRPQSTSDEVRGVWVAYLSLDNVNKVKIDNIISNAKKNGMNTIYFHVRPFGDALYKSEYYPWSHLVTGTQGQAPSDGFDPLAYAVEAAHREGLELHAWLNPLRIMLDSGVYPPSLSDDNPYNVWRNDDDADNDDWVIDYGKGKYYNPAIPEVRDMIVNGVEEIVEKYNVDGIHWDDYFYPASDESFDDSEAYSEYTSGGGKLSLLEWRTQNISTLVKSVYSAVKSIDSSVEFGISPSGNIDNCLRAGADVKTWGSQEGYVDYLCPQIYWTNDNKIAPFEEMCSKWRETVTSDKVKLYVGLALYKAGSDDDNGKWKTSNKIIMNQVLFTRSEKIHADGFALYSYPYLDNEQTAEEMENLRSVL
jgi:uncharacterized lipoprotein YddW (UPF0748 family)